jgi:hypothetical protein
MGRPRQYPSQLDSDNSENTTPKYEKGATEPNEKPEGLPLGMNEHYQTEPNSREIAVLGYEGKKDSNSYSDTSSNEPDPNPQDQNNSQQPGQGNRNQGNNNQNHNRSNNQNWTNFFPGNLNNGNRIINVNINGVPQNTNFDLNGFLGQISGLLGNQDLGRCVQDSVNMAMQQVNIFVVNNFRLII